MTTNTIRKRMLEMGSALQVLAVIGAGAAIGTVTATPAAAQDYTNVTASGRIVGTNGESIPGATVTITSNDQGFTRTATTDSSGSFRVPQLPQGSYTFTISADGFDSFTDPSVSLTQSSAANQFALVPVGGSGDEIVVTAGRVRVVDFDSNTTGAVINVGELASRVPVARDITSVVLLAPGTSQGDNAFGNLPSIAGASVSENAYYVNGLNITDFFNGLNTPAIPFDLYQTVEVKNGGISAEFGRTTGGFINATTKSGSNQLHGSISIGWEPDALRSDPPNTYAADNDASYASREEITVQLSGPIIKDHLFFYGIYQNRDVRSGNGVTGVTSLAATATPPEQYVPWPDVPANNIGGAEALSYLTGTQYFRDRNNSPFYAAKVDAVIVDGQRFELTYINTESLTRRHIYGTSMFPLADGRYDPVTNDPGNYASTTLFRAGGENYVGRYTGTFTDWLTVSAGYGRSNMRNTTESSTPDVSSIIDQRSGASTQLANPTANSSRNFGRREFYRADADVFFDLFGSHHIRGGYDREDLRADASTKANGDYQIAYQNSGPAGNALVNTPNTIYVTRRWFQNGGIFTTKGEAFYLQDSWQLFDNHLQLNLGVRNDRFVNKNADGDTFFNSGNNWAPRLGFSVDPFGDARTKVYGSFGRYFLPVATNTNVRLAGPELDYTTYHVLAGINADQTPILGAPIQIAGGVECPELAIPGDQTGGENCTVNSDGTTPPYASLVSSNLSAQSRDEYVVGIEQRVGSLWRFGAFYTHRKLNESLEDAYIDSGVRAFCRREFASDEARLDSCLSIWSGFHQYALLNPGNDVTVELDGIIEGDTAPRTVTLSAEDLGLPQATAKYNAVTFTADREFDGVWSLSASYTWSSLKGNIEGGVRSDNGQVDSGLTTAFDFPALVDGAYGYLPGHRRHNFKLFGSYSPLEWLVLGANLQVTSPRKFGCIGTVPSTRDADEGSPSGYARQYGAAGFYCNVVDGVVQTTSNGFTSINDPINREGGPRPTTLTLTPRGSQFESDWLYNLNLDAAVKLPFEMADMTLRVSVFNVLNRKAKLDFNEVGTTAAGAPSVLYGQPLQYQSPRSFRLTFGAEF